MTPAERDQADENAVDHAILPATPGEIRSIQHRYFEMNQAAHGSLAKHLRSRTVSISLMIGDATPVVRTSYGYTTVVSFIDATGKPWPIVRLDTGNKAQFLVTIPGLSQGGKADMTSGLSFNSFTVTPQTPYGRTDMIVFLQGEATPVNLILSEVRDNADLRVAAKVMARGPNSEAPIFASEEIGLSGHAPQDSAIQAILDGIPPKDAVRMKIHDRMGGDIEAWTIGKFLYIRTVMDILSPPWIERESGSGGVHAYRMNPVHAFYVADSDGNLHLATITRDHDMDKLDTR